MRGAKRVEFKAYKGHELRLHTWAIGAAIDVERSAYQTRLNRGDFDRVEVVEPTMKTTTMLREPRA